MSHSSPAGGTYVLVLRVEKPVACRIGSLGIKRFVCGLYAYVGSAKSGYEFRLRRHFSRTRKKKHWHIDYLLSERFVRAELALLLGDSDECSIARMLASEGEALARFGSSDCTCRSHLIHLRSDKLRALETEFRISIVEAEKMWGGCRRGPAHASNTCSGRARSCSLVSRTPSRESSRRVPDG